MGNKKCYSITKAFSIKVKIIFVLSFYKSVLINFETSKQKLILSFSAQATCRTCVSTDWPTDNSSTASSALDCVETKLSLVLS